VGESHVNVGPYRHDIASHRVGDGRDVPKVHYTVAANILNKQ